MIVRVKNEKVDFILNTEKLIGITIDGESTDDCTMYLDDGSKVPLSKETYEQLSQLIVEETSVYPSNKALEELNKFLSKVNNK